MEKFIFILVLFLIVVLIIVGIGFSLRCPKCKKWWSLRNDDRKITNENTKYESVKRVDIQKDRNGRKVGSTTRREQIRVNYTHYLNYHSCKKCGHKWTSTSIDRKEL